MKKMFFVFLISMGCLLTGCTSPPETSNNQDITPQTAEGKLAQCISNTGAKMYGAEWCPHCHQQKDAFGEEKSLVPYIECTKEKKTCSAAGITGYPTWVFADGSKLSGNRPLTELAQKTGCEY